MKYKTKCDYPKSRISAIALSVLFFAILITFPAPASAIPSLCQHKVSKKISQRINCRASERQIFDLSRTDLVFMGRTTSQLGPAGAIQYLVPSGAADATGTESLARMLIAKACEITDLRVKLDTAPGQGESRDFIFVVNGVSEGTSCNISNDETSCTASLEKVLNAGDSISIEAETSLDPARSYAEYSWVCQTN